MNMEFRLLLSGENSAAMNMAIDEAVMRAQIPTLRLYGWRPSAVSIGYFQGIEQEVDAGMCKKLGVDIVRRMTGGGAVFHDKEITYSFFVSEDSDLVSRDILKSYGQICNGIVLGLRRLGLSPEFKPINDIIVNGQKISGNAQTRKDGMILQHGTVLLEVDVKKMFSLLKVPDEKIRDKMIAAAEDRVTSLNDELRAAIDTEKVNEALVLGFKEALNLTPKPGMLSESEKREAENLCKTKYSTREWSYMR
ncbi:MAG: lipoate--protein ligase family protein [Candidatus Altiarchaeota archaeon]|nr:lipoate--protein ligase family protein [Candidatus Altiarchaeota archaeon]